MTDTSRRSATEAEAPIRNIVFDVGKVLIDFQYTDLLAFLHQHGLPHMPRAALLEKIRLDPYECGEITSEEFLDNLNGLLTSPVHTDELRDRWVTVFSPIPEMLDLAHRLSEVSRVYLLSNASDLHWNHLWQEMDIQEIGHGRVASFELGVRKPDAAIYRAAEARFDLLPEQTVFIDDMAENAEGARACGWQAIHHTSPASTQRILHTLPGPHQTVV